MPLFTKDTGAAPERALPRHIAAIMDGNGRWAVKRGLPRKAGHAAGAEALRKVLYHCRDIGMEYLTVYAFSTENWKRSEEEVGALMVLLKKYLEEAIDNMERERIKLYVMGDLGRLSPELRALSDRALEKSKTVEGMQLNVCFNYGSKSEIVRAANLVAQSGLPITEQSISENLWVPELPDIDLVIRTSGEQRLSNCMLWQAAYAEISFTDCLWPDFGPAELDAALEWFDGRKRRFGGV